MLRVGFGEVVMRRREGVINITTKEYLKQTFKLDAQINSLIQELEVVETKATKVTTVLNPDKVEKSAGFSSNNQEDLIVKIIDYKNLVNQYIDELVDLKKDILERISKMENQDYKTILMLRYINLMSFEEIAVEINYTYRHTTRLHGRALAEFEKMSYNVL